jgi:acyl-CoA reductase-like NAD-dependent aldehyde dehydrogenase
VADEFASLVSHEAEQMQVGSGLDAGVQVGPMVSRRQRDHVVAQIEDAQRRGAKVLTGGQTSENGHFLTPTVLDDVTHEMDVATIETFGPVASIIRVDDDDEAVRLANDSPFGLGAIVFGGDEVKAEALARRLDAGMVGVNRGVGGANGTPWVGARQSGYGYHKSVAGHRQFTQIRVLSRRAKDA